jgi:hypothetical protein
VSFYLVPKLNRDVECDYLKVMTAGLVSGQFLIYGAVRDGKDSHFKNNTWALTMDCLSSVGCTAWFRDP